MSRAWVGRPPCSAADPILFTYFSSHPSQENPKQKDSHCETGRSLCRPLGGTAALAGTGHPAGPPLLDPMRTLQERPLQALRPVRGNGVCECPEHKSRRPLRTGPCGSARFFKTLLVFLLLKISSELSRAHGLTNFGVPCDPAYCSEQHLPPRGSACLLGGPHSLQRGECLCGVSGRPHRLPWTITPHSYPHQDVSKGGFHSSKQGCHTAAHVTD